MKPMPSAVTIVITSYSIHYTKLYEVDSAIVINANGIDDPAMADFLLLPPSASLPPAGLLGVFVRRQAQELVIDDLTADGPAMRAGLT